MVFDAVLLHFSIPRVKSQKLEGQVGSEPDNYRDESLEWEVFHQIARRRLDANIAESETNLLSVY